jgi:predicted phage terminase large subunit-like protein
MKNLILNRTDLLAIDREIARRSLAEFAKMAWPLLEPSTPLKWGWALDALCAHLEAVTYGQIQNLLANVPPGMMKSLMVNVIWPAWEWGPAGKPHLRSLNTSHKQELAVRDSMKCRRLITSQWFQERWPLVLMQDQNTKTKFENQATGFIDAMAFTSMTGSRGDRVKLDDPLSVDSANSEADLKSAELTFNEALPTRVNDLEKSSIIVIMQRLHSKDTSGIILDTGLDFVHLCLPMEFDPERRCVTPIFSDPRTYEGELLFPERFPAAAVAKLKKQLGSYGSAGQLQQRPSPRGGGMLKRHWFTVKSAAPTGVRWVRAWDLAATDDPSAAWTAGAKIGEAPDGNFWIGDMRRIQGSAEEVERLLRNTASRDGIGVKGSIPQDPGQAGKAQVQYLIKKLAGYPYTSSPESGDKATRASPFAAQSEAGNVYLVDGPWVETFLAEAEEFPFGKWKDQIDAVSRGFAMLTASSGYNLDNL